MLLGVELPWDCAAFSGDQLRRVWLPSRAHCSGQEGCLSEHLQGHQQDPSLLIKRQSLQVGKHKKPHSKWQEQDTQRKTIYRNKKGRAEEGGKQSLISAEQSQKQAHVRLPPSLGRSSSTNSCCISPVRTSIQKTVHEQSVHLQSTRFLLTWCRTHLQSHTSNLTHSTNGCRTSTLCASAWPTGSHPPGFPPVKLDVTCYECNVLARLLL